MKHTTLGYRGDDNCSGNQLAYRRSNRPRKRKYLDGVKGSQRSSAVNEPWTIFQTHTGPAHKTPVERRSDRSRRRLLPLSKGITRGGGVWVCISIRFVYTPIVSRNGYVFIGAPAADSKARGANVPSAIVWRNFSFALSTVVPANAFARRQR